jgi:hypothetical protein
VRAVRKACLESIYELARRERVPSSPDIGAGTLDGFRKEFQALFHEGVGGEHRRRASGLA